MSESVSKRSPAFREDLVRGQVRNHIVAVARHPEVARADREPRLDERARLHVRGRRLGFRLRELTSHPRTKFHGGLTANPEPCEVAEPPDGERDVERVDACAPPHDPAPLHARARHQRQQRRVLRRALGGGELGVVVLRQQGRHNVTFRVTLHA